MGNLCQWVIRANGVNGVNVVNDFHAVHAFRRNLESVHQLRPFGDIDPSGARIIPAASNKVSLTFWCMRKSYEAPPRRTEYSSNPQCLILKCSHPS